MGEGLPLPEGSTSLKGVAMRAHGSLLAGLIGLPLLCATAPAPCPPPPNRPRVPDMSGPGFVATGKCGEKYYPSYYVYPPMPPFQGMLLGPCPPGCNPAQKQAVTDAQAMAELAMRQAAIASGAYPGF